MIAERKIDLETPAKNEQIQPQIVRKSMILSPEDYDLHVRVARLIPGELGSHNFALAQETLHTEANGVAVVYEGTGYDDGLGRFMEAARHELDYANFEGKTPDQADEIMVNRLRIEIRKEKENRGLVEKNRQ